MNLCTCQEELPGNAEESIVAKQVVSRILKVDS